MGNRLPVLLLVCAILAGCGTTKWTDTKRSATEQLLISDAMDRAVSRLDLRALAGKTVYIDEKPLKEVTDASYLVSSLKQHMLASGCSVKDKEADADYIVEVRAGAVGTDHHDLIYGIPAVNIPAMVPVGGFGIPSQIPEMPFVKKTDQRAVTKIAVFAYNRQTGRPLWQSGIVPMESTAKNIWVFGAGPFQRGDIYGGVNFAGDKLDIPLIDLGHEDGERSRVSVADEAYFREPAKDLVKSSGDSKSADSPELSKSGEKPAPPKEGPKVIQTGHTPPGTKENEQPAQAKDGETAPAKPPPAAPQPSREPAIQPPPPHASPIDPAAPPLPKIRLDEESPDSAWFWFEETAGEE